MIIPHKQAIELLGKLNLPVYRPEEEIKQFKCHFRDVVKRLCRFALNSLIDGYSPNGIQFK